MPQWLASTICDEIPSLEKQNYKNKFHCDYPGCGRSYGSRAELDHHKTNPKFDHIWCEKCKVWCDDYKDFVRHKDISPNHVSCPECGRDTLCYEGVKHHMLMFHPKSKCLICEGCRKVFQHHAAMIGHFEKGGCRGIPQAEYEAEVARRMIIDKVLKDPARYDPSLLVVPNDSGKGTDEVGPYGWPSSNGDKDDWGCHTINKDPWGSVAATKNAWAPKPKTAHEQKSGNETVQPWGDDTMLTKAWATSMEPTHAKSTSSKIKDTWSHSNATNDAWGGDTASFNHLLDTDVATDMSITALEPTFVDATLSAISTGSPSSSTYHDSTTWAPTNAFITEDAALLNHRVEIIPAHSSTTTSITKGCDLSGPNAPKAHDNTLHNPAGSWSNGNTTSKLFPKAKATPFTPARPTTTNPASAVTGAVAIADSATQNIPFLATGPGGRTYTTNLFSAKLHDPDWTPSCPRFNAENFYNVDTELYECPFPHCADTYEEPKHFKDHIRRSHEPEEKRFACPKCFKEFASRARLASHVENLVSRCGIGNLAWGKQVMEDISAGYMGMPEGSGKPREIKRKWFRQETSW